MAIILGLQRGRAFAARKTNAPANGGINSPLASMRPGLCDPEDLTRLIATRVSKVKATHAGFAAPGSGVFNQQLKMSSPRTLRLLAEKPVTQVALAR